MKTRTNSWLFLFALLLGLFALTANRAVADDDDDPPGRVARLSYAHGQVSFSPAGTDDWVSAVLNRPITIGDKLWTDQDSRAELQIGSSVVRLDAMTGFSFLNLDDRVTQIRLTEGTVDLRVRHLGDRETIEVDTPNLAFSVLRPGDYRINVNEAGDTSIINVRDGQGEVTGGGSAYTLHAGDQGIFSGTDTLSSDVEPLAEEDDFDNWCEERDHREDHAAARKYVSDDVIGYEDLDDYGGWRPVPEYGTVWFPHVTVVNWAPYRFGHWVWVSPWGWTWVDDAPWGFAPFHYGRWVFVGGAWGWVPCPPRPVVGVYVRPVYAPALVAWVGGPHFGVGVAVGGAVGVGVNVGWFPLGYREVYVPSYHASRTYINNVNISNTTVNQTVINNYYNTTIVNKNVTVNNVRYANQNVAGAVTATSQQTFSSAQPVGRNMVVVNQREITAAPVAVRGPAVVPPRQAVLGAGAAVNYHPPAAIQARPVVARTAPPPPPPSFDAHRAAIERNQGQPISLAQQRQIQTQNPQVRTAAPPVRIAPPAKAATPTYGQRPDFNRTNVSPNVNRPANVGQGNSPNNPANNPANRPNVGQGNPPSNPANQNNTQSPGFRDRPPTSRPVQANPQLEQKHQQEIQQLQRKNDLEYQRVQQQQAQEQQRLQQQQKLDQQRQQQLQQEQQQQKLDQQRQQQLQQRQQQLEQQQKADQQRQQEMQQRQQQQREQMMQKQQQEQQNLRQRQENEHRASSQPQPKPQAQPKEAPKPKENPKPKDDKHR